MRVKAIGDGDDQRPGRGSELLRRLPCQASSSSTVAELSRNAGLLVEDRAAALSSSVAGDCR